MSTSPMWVIARRELLERIKSKWFVVITAFGPLFMIALIVIPAVIARSSVKGAKIDILDETGVLAQPLSAGFGLVDWKPTIVAATTTDEAENARILKSEINGYLRIPKDALDSGQPLYQGDNASNQVVHSIVTELVQAAIQAQRGTRAKIDPAALSGVLAHVSVRVEQNTGHGTSSSGLGSYLIAYVLAFILYMVITLYGVNVMRSVVQEKSSRVIELMVAAVKPRSLMAGKILGVGTAGLIQVTVWLAMGAAVLAYRDVILGWFGVAGGGAALPSLGVIEIAVIISYFILGFFFYASMYAAVGAMVSSEQDSAQVQMPVTMLMIIGIMCVNMISNDPRGSTSEIMTMVPLWSPMLMPMRFFLGGATAGEVAISLGILVISTVLIVRAAAKIYRVGVLMYGKRPSFRELLRWLRY